jgi:hypothetical protein
MGIFFFHYDEMIISIIIMSKYSRKQLLTLTKSTLFY